MKARSELLVIPLCLLGAAAQAETVGVPLNKQEIVQLVKGNTAEGKKNRY
jgi:hypothetical protein